MWERCEFLAREGDPSACLYPVVSGNLQVTQNSPNQPEPLNLGAAGLVNNIPADIMRQKVGAGTVFAADVSPKTEFTAGQEFGLHVSGWQVTARNFNPFTRKKKMGTLADVLMRLIRMGGAAHDRQIQASADLYLTIPLDQFNIRDFHRGEEMSQIGYRHAKEKLASWIEKNGRPWRGNASS